jgi:hypothetical protein
LEYSGSTGKSRSEKRLAAEVSRKTLEARLPG